MHECIFFCGTVSLCYYLRFLSQTFLLLDVAVASTKRKAAPLRSTLTDITNTITKRRDVLDPKVARGLSFGQYCAFALSYNLRTKRSNEQFPS